MISAPRTSGCRLQPTRPAPPRSAAVCLLLAMLAFNSLACRPDQDVRRGEETVVVYCSVDEAFARRILQHFSQETGISVQPVFDSEAGKTTGLVNRILAEAHAGRPRAQVFWSSEIFNTILLARQGLLEPYDSPAARDIPDRYRDPARRWTGVSVRARVITCRPSVGAEGRIPTHWEQIADPDFAPRLAFANPLFGTTRGHVAAMFALWGTVRATSFLTALRDHGAQILDSNSATVRAVLAGRADCAATDSDDVWVAQKSGVDLTIAYPDMGDGGTLLIPCTVALVHGSPATPSARRLVDFLVSDRVERMLAESDSRNVPVRDALRNSLDLTLPPETTVSYDAVAGAMAEAEAAVREILLR